MILNVFNMVRSKIPIEQISDEELLFKVEEVSQTIKTYCNREDIPNELRFVHTNMVIDVLKQEIKDAEPSNFMVAKSVKEGDVSVEFGTTMTQSEQSTMIILANYTSQLNRFRKLRW